MAQSVVGPGTRVTLHFSLSLGDGTEVDSTFDSEPATFEFGDGNLPENFEALLVGLAVGVRQSFEVPPEKAFGQRNPNNVQSFRKDQFAEDLALEPGSVISFADARKAELPGIIHSIEGDTVVVDFNHPLAGETLRFDVAILDVQPVE